MVTGTLQHGSRWFPRQYPLVAANLFSTRKIGAMLCCLYTGVGIAALIHGLVTTSAAAAVVASPHTQAPPTGKALMTIRVLKSTDHRRMLWKNGSGETAELAIFPEGSGLSDFGWRISMATVTTDGRFSVFPVSIARWRSWKDRALNSTSTVLADASYR